MRGPIRVGAIGATVLAATIVATGPALASGPVGTSFPSDFPVPKDASLGVPVIGFGAKGPVSRTPVIFLHGNNDTPYPTSCNSSFGKIQRFAQYFHANGYALSELWGPAIRATSAIFRPTRPAGPRCPTRRSRTCRICVRS